MTINFSKYEGAGNDFIMVDNRGGGFPKENTELIARLCHRRFGIGADGVILLEADNFSDFRMVYFNADGRPGSMCGNGGRCIVAFANHLGVTGKSAIFDAADGKHEAVIGDDGQISLKMKDVDQIRTSDDYCFLDTGSPHHVALISEVDAINVKAEGARIRYSDLYDADGVNVNFTCKLDEDTFMVRTYERGVEDETYSCGTGVTAVAVAMHATGHSNSNNVTLITPGGRLQVRFKRENGIYSDIFLVGPAKHVYDGLIKF